LKVFGIGKQKGFGDYRHFVTVQIPQKTSGFSATEIEPILFAQVWCSIMPVDSTEKEMDHKVQSQTTHRIEMHFLPGLNSQMQIVEGNRKFKIASFVNVDEKGFTHVIEAVEVNG
jgi:head-tail adaptor